MSERLALIIAASDYHDRRFRRLRAPPVDAKQLGAVLRDPTVGGFTDVKELLNQPRQMIEEAIEALFANRQPDDLALLYFSCHGITDRHGQLRFVTTPTRFDRLGSTTVSSMFVKDQMELSRARSKVVLLDCCHGGAFARGFVPKSADGMDLTGQVQSRGSVVIASSGALQYAFEDDHLTSDQTGPSLFTGAVVRGLGTGEADRDGDGRISARDLFDYVYDRVRAATTDQTPTWSAIGVQGDIHLAWAREARRRISTAEPRGMREARPVLPGPDRPVDPQDASEALALDTDGWVRLLDYYIDCLEQEAALSGIPVEASPDQYVVCPSGSEELLSGSRDRLEPDANLLDLARRAASQERALYYGYPTVVFRDDTRRPAKPSDSWSLAPLLLLELRLDDGPDGEFLTATGAKVLIHPALVNTAKLAEEEFRGLAEAYEPRWRANDLDELSRAVRELLAELGISQVHDVDAAALPDDLELWPRRQGARNVAVVFKAETAEGPTNLVRKDLRDIRDHPERIAGTALAALADGRPALPEPIPTVIAPIELNDAQEDALISAMADPLTVVTGPPGTGKSQFITNVVATAWADRHDRSISVVLASTNNNAVDVVVERADAVVARGLIVRTGNERFRERERELLEELLEARYPTPNLETLGGDVRAHRKRVEGHRRRLDERAEVEASLERLAVKRERLADQFGWKADDLPGPLGDDRGLRRWRRLTRWAIRPGWLGWGPRILVRTRLRLTAAPLILERLYRLLQCEGSWGDSLRGTRGLPSAESLWRELVGAEQPYRVASKEIAAARVADEVHRGHARIDDLVRARRANARTWPLVRAVVPHLRAWGVTTHSARTLPLDPGLFDLAIIDEASQCTIPAVLPILFRARRALIVGDPEQLQPVTTLPENQERACRRRASLPAGWLDARHLGYKSHSAFFALRHGFGEPLLLDEHYRSHPEIIELANRRSYRGSLTILTDLSKLCTNEPPAVRWIDVQGRSDHPSAGSCQNEEEAWAVREEVLRLYAELPTGSIGVVTPFRGQRLLLERLLRDVVSSERVLVGTVHTFQGKECDVVVVSPVAAPGIHDHTRDWLLRGANLWNVAITRPRARLIVVGDRSFWSGRKGVLADIAHGRLGVPSSQARDEEALERLHEALLTAGLRFDRGARCNGYQCDFLVESPNGPLAILVDSPGDDGVQDGGRRLRQQLKRRELLEREVGQAELVPAWWCLRRAREVASGIARGAAGSS